MSNFNAVHKVIMFGFNYPNGFINSVWSGNIASHLQSKFNNFYDVYGSTAVFQMFYTSLDNENQALLIEWILQNYKG
jgi:hypothetical protein